MTVYYETEVAPMIARVRYFNNEFLKDQDFIDEQIFHIAAQRRHASGLHLAGVVQGLLVQSVQGGARPTATLTSGYAYDNDGRQILVARSDDSSTTGSVEISGLDPIGESQLLYIVFGEIEGGESQSTDAGASGKTRYLQVPHIQATASGAPPPPGGVLLASLALDSNQSFVATDARELSGMAFPSRGPERATLRSEADLGSQGLRLTGSLAVTGPLATSNRLDVGGAAEFSGLLTAAAGLNVSGQPLDVASSASMAAGLTITGGGLRVTGATSVNGALTVSSGLTVTGASRVNNGLTVAGGITVQDGGLSVTGGSAFSSGLTVNGGLTVGGTGTLDIAGNTLFRQAAFLSDQALYIRRQGDGNHYLQYDNSTNGPALVGYNGVTLGGHVGPQLVTNGHTLQIFVSANRYWHFHEDGDITLYDTVQGQLAGYSWRTRQWS
jgi:hypothetical protein